jgi:hypothetical protein
VSLNQKLATFDRHAPAAVDFIISWLTEERDALMAESKGRLVEGHYRFGDRLMYEYDQDTLRAEASQELADAINYVHLLLSRQTPVHRLGGPRAVEGTVA